MLQSNLKSPVLSQNKFKRLGFFSNQVKKRELGDFLGAKTCKNVIQLIETQFSYIYMYKSM